ncbi:MAG: hypothetical protein B6D71_07690 [gamma proteobacterium symbiont of Stewartia floridana]|nr:MAG: hypothetical protein B6D71_07690 [gamma proteobacterium symbiont of Stewartia floridana]
MPKILIVEDEPEIREMIRFALEPKGFVLSEADNAQDARKLLADHNYDLILMDWMLPGRSGLDLTKELKQVSPVSTPIILLTAKADEADKVIGLDSGADDYITKQFTLSLPGISAAQAEESTAVMAAPIAPTSMAL